MSIPILSLDSERAIHGVDEKARASALAHEHIVGSILAAFFEVYRELGHGFSQAVYAKALVLELMQRGLVVDQDALLSVFYKGRKVGTFRADVVVEGTIVLEVMAGNSLSHTDRFRLVNCMRCSRIDVGMLLHFGPRPEFRRFVGGAEPSGAPRTLD